MRPAPHRQDGGVSPAGLKPQAAEVGAGRAVVRVCTGTEALNT
jgi:hypothetical protein